MNKILLIILLLLMIYVGGKRGIKIFAALILNFMFLMLAFYLIAVGINPIVISLICCLIICYIVLYFIIGENIKTRSSMMSVMLVLILLLGLILLTTYFFRICGFGYEAYEEINMFSYDVRLDFNQVSIALILLGLIGAAIDSSIAISSALYEVYRNNNYLNKHELFKSGINIGKDILGTTTNTLLFAFLGEFMTLLIWFKIGNYSFLDIVNAKSFCAEFVKILISAIGCILVIPISAKITANNLIKDEYGELNFKK